MFFMLLRDRNYMFFSKFIPNFAVKLVSDLYRSPEMLKNTYQKAFLSPRHVTS